MGFNLIEKPLVGMMKRDRWMLVPHRYASDGYFGSLDGKGA